MTPDKQPADPVRERVGEIRDAARRLAGGLPGQWMAHDASQLARMCDALWWSLAQPAPEPAVCPEPDGWVRNIYISREKPGIGREHLYTPVYCRSQPAEPAACPEPLAWQPLPMTNVVPGKVHCAKCGFTLVRTNLYVRSGTTGPGGEEAEPCPNDGNPLLPVTWEQEAREAWARCEEMFDRATAAEKALAAPPPAETAAGALTDEQIQTRRHLLKGLVDIHNNPRFKLGWTEQSIIQEACEALSLATTKGEPT